MKYFPWDLQVSSGPLSLPYECTNGRSAKLGRWYGRLLQMGKGAADTFQGFRVIFSGSFFFYPNQ